MSRGIFLFLLFLKCLKPHKLIVLKMKFEIRAECIQLRQHGPYLRQCVLLAVAELHDVVTVGDAWWEVNDVVDGWRGAWSDRADTMVYFSVQNVSQLERLVEGRSAGTKNRLGTALMTGKGTDIWYSLEFQSDKSDSFLFTDLGLSSMGL